MSIAWLEVVFNVSVDRGESGAPHELTDWLSSMPTGRSHWSKVGSTLAVPLLAAEVERALGVRLAWRTAEGVARWEVEQVQQAAGPGWAPPMPDKILELPVPEALKGVVWSCRLPASFQLEAPAPPRPVPHGVDDAELVSFDPPVNLPVIGDLMLGEVGRLLSGHFARLEHGTPFPGDAALLGQKTSAGMVAWGETVGRLMPEQDGVGGPSAHVRLDIVETSHAPAALSAVRDLTLADVRPWGARRGGFTPFEDALVDLLGGGPLASLADEVLACRPLSQAPKAWEVRDALAQSDAAARSSLLAAFRGGLAAMQRSCAALRRLSQLARRHEGLALGDVLVGRWRDTSGRLVVPPEYDVVVHDFTIIAERLDPARDGDSGLEKVSDELLKAQSQRPFSEARSLDDVVYHLHETIHNVRRQRMDKVLLRRRELDADHGAMCVAAACAVVSDVVPVRAVQSPGLDLGDGLDDVRTQPDLKVVRSASLGSLIKPERGSADNVTLDLARQEIQEWPQDRVLFVLAVSNASSRDDHIDRWILLAGLPNVLLVGGCSWSLMPGNDLVPFASLEQDGYRVKFAGKKWQMPDVCGPTNAGVGGNALVYPAAEDGRWRLGSGSSQATPIVAATCALLWRKRPALSAPELKQAVLAKGCTRPLQPSSVFHHPAKVPDIDRWKAKDNDGARTVQLDAAMRHVAGLKLRRSSLFGRRR